MACSSSVTTSIAHIGNVTACLTHSPDIGPWILDSGASEHISGNKHLFTHISNSSSLPSITIANGCKTIATGIGQAQILPSLFVDSILYVPESPFNLISVSKLIRSHNCSITFAHNCVSIQDRSTGRMIGIGRESEGLYHLSPVTSPVACPSSSYPSLLHNRLGHPSVSKLRQMDASLSTLSSLPCESCQLGKHTRSSFSGNLNSRSTSPFQLVHSDVWGPSRVPSVFGFQYFVTFIDDYSRCTWLYLMKSRSEVFDIFQSFCAEIKTQFNTSVSILRSDNAKEYLSTPFKTFMTSQGILHQTSCPYTPQQNGIAERKNRHLIETARTLLIHNNVPTKFWSDAVLTACYLINRMPSSTLNNQIPHSLLFPTDPLYHLPPRVFGCVCFVHDLTPGKDKLTAKSIKCIFLGYARLQKGYRCYCPATQRCFTSPDVTFFESTPFFESPVSSSPPVTEVLPVLPEPSLQEPSSPPLQTYHRRPRPDTTGPPSDSQPLSAPLVAPIQPPPESPPIAIHKGIRSTRNPHPVYNFLSYHRLSTPYYAFVSSLDSVSIPKTTDEALAHPGWRQAMLDEMSALHSNGTWDLVSLPPGKSPVGCRWVYAVKVGPDGTVERLKARLVAKGYTQIFGLDYGDTFSPVAKIASVRVFLSIAAIRHWPLYQLDIKNAFLHGELEEEVYMEQPPGFVAQGEYGKVCRLRRSLYGLKQSPRAWFGRFSSVIQDFGMTRSEADHTVFFRHTANGKCIYMVVYVDDIVITGDDDEGIAQLKQHLCNHFQTKDLGKLKYFLGIEVAQSSTGVAISQRKYALDLLEEAGMMNCKPIETPMDPNVRLYPGQGELINNPERYRRLVGKLNYLTITRPDISFAVSVVSQFLQSPCDSHWDAVVRILRYIKGAPGQGLLYENKGNSQIVAFSDADWAGSPDDRRSTSGYCVLIGGNLVSWKSKKQNVVARSSAEAEYRAMALATCELVWLKQLLQELKFGDIHKMELVCDNQAAMHIASNPVFHERTKHIEIDCHFIREKIQSGCLATRFVNSNDQLADILTKSLRGPRIKYLCGKLGAYDIYAPA